MVRKKRRKKEFKWKEWKVIRRTFPEGVRYLLQKRFTDATKPYWLTRRIFRAKGPAMKLLGKLWLEPDLIE